MQLGNPSSATADTNNANNYLIQRTIETLSYNNALEQTKLGKLELTAGDANGAANRQGPAMRTTRICPRVFIRFKKPITVIPGLTAATCCRQADRTDSTNDNNLTFLMSNMMPQAPDNNEVTWGAFQNYCRAQCYSNNYECSSSAGRGLHGRKINTNGYVWIPQYTWKIAVVVPPGISAVTNRITATNRVIAIKVPNTNGISSNWQAFITSANQIQVDTGFSFFTSLPPDVAAALRAKVDGSTNPPPGHLHLFAHQRRGRNECCHHRHQFQRGIRRGVRWRGRDVCREFKHANHGHRANQCGLGIR